MTVTASRYVPFLILTVSPFLDFFTAAWIFENLQPRLHTVRVLPLPFGADTILPGSFGSG